MSHLCLDCTNFLEGILDSFLVVRAIRSRVPVTELDCSEIVEVAAGRSVPELHRPRRHYHHHQGLAETAAALCRVGLLASLHSDPRRV